MWPLSIFFLAFSVAEEMVYSIMFLAVTYLDMSIFIDFNYKMLFSFILYKCP